MILKRKFGVPIKWRYSHHGTLGTSRRSIYCKSHDDEFTVDSKDGTHYFDHEKILSKLNSYYLRYALIYFVDKINKISSMVKPTYSDKLNY